MRFSSILLAYKSGDRKPVGLTAGEFWVLLPVLGSELNDRFDTLPFPNQLPRLLNTLLLLLCTQWLSFCEHWELPSICCSAFMLLIASAVMRKRHKDPQFSEDLRCVLFWTSFVPSLSNNPTLSSKSGQLECEIAIHTWTNEVTYSWLFQKPERPVSNDSRFSMTLVIFQSLMYHLSSGEWYSWCDNYKEHDCRSDEYPL